jgi:chromosome partitioning protein
MSCVESYGSKMVPDPSYGFKESAYPAVVENLAPLGRRVVSAIEREIENYDLIVIDTPPAVESESPWAALQISDLAIVPFIPTPADSWASEARELAKKAANHNPDLIDTYHLASNYRRGLIIDGVLDGYREDKEINIFNTVIHQRMAYLLSQSCGLCVNQLPKSKSGGAEKEIDRLVIEVASIIGISINSI